MQLGYEFDPEPQMFTRTAARSDADFRHREAALLDAMSKADLAEQQRLAADLDALRSERRAAKADAEALDLANAAWAAHLTPVATHVHHTASTDWLDGVEDHRRPSTDETHWAVAQASLWYQRLPEEVRADGEELAVQAQGKARVVTAGTVDKAGVKAAFLAQVAHHARRDPLVRRAAMERHADWAVADPATPDQESETGTDPRGRTISPSPSNQSGAAESALPDEIGIPPETFDNFAPPIAPENAGNSSADGYHPPMPGATGAHTAGNPGLFVVRDADGSVISPAITQERAMELRDKWGGGAYVDTATNARADGADLFPADERVFGPLVGAEGSRSASRRTAGEFPPEGGDTAPAAKPNLSAACGAWLIPGTQENAHDFCTGAVALPPPDDVCQCPCHGGAAEAQGAQPTARKRSSRRTAMDIWEEDSQWVCPDCGGLGVTPSGSCGRCNGSGYLDHKPQAEASRRRTAADTCSCATPVIAKSEDFDDYNSAWDGKCKTCGGTIPSDKLKDATYASRRTATPEGKAPGGPNVSFVMGKYTDLADPACSECGGWGYTVSPTNVAKVRACTKCLPDGWRSTEDNGYIDVFASRTAADGQTCDVCGDSITRDPEGEENRTWHHTNGESHDHEAVPNADKLKAPESRRIAAGGLVCSLCGGDVEILPSSTDVWVHTDPHHVGHAVNGPIRKEQFIARRVTADEYDTHEQSGQGESSLPQVEVTDPQALETLDQFHETYPTGAPEGPADVASVPTPGSSVADYPQPKSSAAEYPPSCEKCKARRRMDGSTLCDVCSGKREMGDTSPPKESVRVVAQYFEADSPSLLKAKIESAGIPLKVINYDNGPGSNPSDALPEGGGLGYRVFEGPNGSKITFTNAPGHGWYANVPNHLFSMVASHRQEAFRARVQSALRSQASSCSRCQGKGWVEIPAYSPGDPEEFYDETPGGSKVEVDCPRCGGSGNEPDDEDLAERNYFHGPDEY